MLTGRMNAPSLSCRFAIAPFRVCWSVVREKIGTKRVRASAWRAEDYFVFQGEVSADVIPGRERSERTSDVQLHIRESLDSGFALRAPRTDGSCRRCVL